MASNLSDVLRCFGDPPGSYIFTSFAVANLLVLPLALYVLYLGFSQWKRRRTASHLDHFTFHTAAMELIPTCGCVVHFVGAFYDDKDLMLKSLAFFSPSWSAKLHFNTLTCVERYLAVVHPITYLGLKKRGGVMIRNVSIAFLWLLALVWPTFQFVPYHVNATSFLVSLCLAFVITSFCNVSVLCVLIRPSPAKGGGDKVKTDQSKKRAFQIVSAIFGVLFLAASGLLLCQTLSMTLSSGECVLWNSAVWFTLPCNLVLPLLFIHRFNK
ncbi:hypothetical protein NQD34_013376 [Periophthalmus magnuspinnatus]|nr:hypothetical protein NQD34_013376 [Periophthalmus magnuspinnatus]